MLQLRYEVGGSMKWVIEYFEQEDTTQPAEVFEDALDHCFGYLAHPFKKRRTWPARSLLSLGTELD